MVIVSLISLLVISFLLHLSYIAKYVFQRQEKYFKRFIITLFLNFIIAGSLIVLSLNQPELVRELDMTVLIWILSGIVMIMLLFVKITIFRNIYRRAQDPQHYHHNFFGKKVLHSSVVKPIEIVIFFWLHAFISFFRLVFCGENY